ncbi:restriction endonuclease subunit S [Stutzerimonas stutzeri]|nr:restriction endonuclease subunit S [Stutzerimonas stutzeri]
MSSEWSETTWGEIATLEYGKAIRDYQNASGGVPVYGTNGPIGWHHTPLCNSDGVVIGRKGAYRGVHYSPKPFFVIDTAFYLKPKIELSARWAYYCLLTYDINGMDSGSAIPSTSRDEFYKLPVKVPALAEQNRIVEVLSLLDDRITLLRETNATLEAIAQALFKSWFVDFDPVRAKAEGRQPEGMDATTAALFPDSFEESELGLVPKGWRHVSLKEVTAIFDSKRVPLSGQERDKRKGTYPYYGAAALMDWVDGYLFDGVYLLLGEDGSVADTAGYPVTQYVWGKIWVNNHAHVLQGKAGVSTEHLMLTLQQTNISPYITGAVQAKLSQTNMWRIPFLRSRDEVAIAFGEAIAPLFNSVRHNHEQAQTLTQLRDTLLPRLISGQLRLPEAEALVAEAV